MEREEIRDLIETLDSVGHSRKLRMSISVGIDPNEFLLTNISAFLEPKRKEMTEREVDMQFMSSISYEVSSVGARDSNKHSIILSGLHWKVREVYEEILKWAWVDPVKTSITSEEDFE